MKSAAINRRFQPRLGGNFSAKNAAADIVLRCRGTMMVPANFFNHGIVSLPRTSIHGFPFSAAGNESTHEEGGEVFAAGKLRENCDTS